ncbi:MAG TPA: hypothetical protein PKD11_13250 [Pyrinomonadaceae bacterium]|nr:hypothetical protein [Pyrinomonadaceae bacterium]
MSAPWNAVKLISKNKAIEKLTAELTELARSVARDYEHRAKDCLTCEVKGSCCTDAHFVNVRITPLEAAAIRRVIDRLPTERREQLDRRIEETVERYELDKPDRAESTYSCPLLDEDLGCVVHGAAKPLPCIMHACYEQRSDMPPDDLQAAMETSIARLNLLTYGKHAVVRPLPVAIIRR